MMKIEKVKRLQRLCGLGMVIGITLIGLGVARVIGFISRATLLGVGVAVLWLGFCLLVYSFVEEKNIEEKEHTKEAKRGE